MNNFNKDQTGYETRTETIATINRFRIPVTMLASAAQVPTARVSDYVRGRSLTLARLKAIEEAVQKISFVWEVFSPYRIILDTPELLEGAFESAKTTHRNRTIATLEQQLGELLKNGEGFQEFRL